MDGVASQLDRAGVLTGQISQTYVLQFGLLRKKTAEFQGDELSPKLDTKSAMW